MSNKKTVLIIDDEEDLRETVEYKFKSKDFEVVTAVDGIDGLEKLKTVKPDLIILDMNMPRMNGLEFYQKIKGADEKPKYPVLVLTARANMEQLFRDLDVDGFMSKPFELDELFKEGESIIKKNSGSIMRDIHSDKARARKVCIVENKLEVFNKLALAFLEAGYMVNSAQSGASAIKRISMDIPDVAVISLGLNDIPGDVAIGKLKNLEATKKVKFVLYTTKSADKAAVTKRISEKGGVDQFVDFVTTNDIIEATELIFHPENEKSED